MRYRLDTQHYHEDRLLEPGTIVGDDTDIPWRDKSGHALAPSLNMTPLDEEGKRLYREKHGGDSPNRDMSQAIPLQGTGDKVKVMPPGTPRPGQTPQQQHAETMKAANPPPNPAPTRVPPAAQPKPPGHDSSKNPGDIKDTETNKAPDVTKL